MCGKMGSERVCAAVCFGDALRASMLFGINRVSWRERGKEEIGQMDASISICVSLITTLWYRENARDSRPCGR